MKVENRKKREARTRKKILKTGENPRLSVFRSNRYLYAQIINDQERKTLAAVHSLHLSREAKQTHSEEAVALGKMLAEKALKAGIERVVFDRGGYRFHGRVKSFAQGCREGGLKF